MIRSPQIQEMSSKKHQNLARKNTNTRGYFLEQYHVHFVNGKTVNVDVRVEHGKGEKNNHSEAIRVARQLHPDLKILKSVYC
jgi:hypothetical protein